MSAGFYEISKILNYQEHHGHMRRKSSRRPFRAARSLLGGRVRTMPMIMGAETPSGQGGCVILLKNNKCGQTLTSGDSRNLWWGIWGRCKPPSGVQGRSPWPPNTI